MHAAGASLVAAPPGWRQQQQQRQQQKQQQCLAVEPASCDLASTLVGQEQEQQQEQQWQTHLQQQHQCQHQYQHQYQQQQQQQQTQRHNWASGSGGRQLAVAGAAAAAQLAAWGLDPDAAAASSEALSSSLVDVFERFLEQIQALGPWGGALFVATVALAEMVPLFPTQPLSLASGLLFGAKKGALFMLLGVTLAGLGAFSIARGVGRPLAERIIKAEMGAHGSGSGSGSGGDGSDGGGSGEGASGMGGAWAAVENAVQSGGFFRQLTAITLLRLTPVVPYSATNYLLGLTPVQLPAFVLGTVGGMSVWSVLYASLGGASRSLLEGGADLELLLADLGDKASRYSQDIAVAGAAAAGVGLAAWLLAGARQQAAGGALGGAEAPPQPPAPAAQQTPPPPPPSTGPPPRAVSAGADRAEVLNHTGKP